MNENIISQLKQSNCYDQVTDCIDIIQTHMSVVVLLDRDVLYVV